MLIQVTSMITINFSHVMTITKKRKDELVFTLSNDDEITVEYSDKYARDSKLSDYMELMK